MLDCVRGECGVRLRGEYFYFFLIIYPSSSDGLTNFVPIYFSSIYTLPPLLNVKLIRFGPHWIAFLDFLYFFSFFPPKNQNSTEIVQICPPGAQIDKFIPHFSERLNKNIHPCIFVIYTLPPLINAKLIRFGPHWIEFPDFFLIFCKKKLKWYQNCTNSSLDAPTCEILP